MVGSEAIRIRPLKFGVQCSRSVCGFQNDAFGHFAEGDELPQGDQQLSGQRDDHRLADASSSVLRSRPVPAGQFAVGLEHQEPPGERDHSVSNARVACSGQPFLAAFYATFLWRSRQASIARQRPAIRYVADYATSCLDFFNHEVVIAATDLRSGTRCPLDDGDPLTNEVGSLGVGWLGCPVRVGYPDADRSASGTV